MAAPSPNPLMPMENPDARRHLSEWALQELLVEEMGWTRRHDPPLLATLGGDTHRLVPFAELRGTVAMLHETPIGGTLPGYAARREIRRQIAERHADPLIGFTDALRTAQIWQWTRREPGRPDAYREHAYHRGHSGEALLATLAELTAALGRSASELSTTPDEHTDPLAAMLLPVLLRRVQRRDPAAFRPGGPAEQCFREETDPRRAVQQLIESAEGPQLVRAFWRALAELSVLDPACGTGDRLLAAREVLEPVYDACLERMAVWLGEAERSRTTHRPEKFSDFRRSLARAADDDPPHPTRRQFIIGSILRDNLYGVDPRPDALEACAVRLAEMAGPDLLPEIDLNLCVGDARSGFANAAEVRQALGGNAGTATLQRLSEEADTVSRALRLLRKLRAAGGADMEDLRSTAAALRSRLAALLAELDGLVPEQPAAASAAGGGSVGRTGGTAPPLHAWAEFHGVMERGGFGLVLGDDPALRDRLAVRARPRSRTRRPDAPGSIRERRAPFGPPQPTPSGATPAMDPQPVPSAQLRRGAPGYPPLLAELLGEATPDTVTARGNVELLRGPLLALFCSVQTPGSIVLRTLDLARELRDRGVAVISGFQSPLERECLDLLLRGSQPVVICPARESEEMRIPAAWQEPLDTGRLLLLSRFGPKQRRPTAALAEQRNEFVAALAERVFLAYAAPGGKIFALARRVLAWGKPVFTFDELHNADLLLMGARGIRDASGALADGRTG